MTHPVGTIIFRDVTKTYQIVQRASPRVGVWVFSKAMEYFRREPFDALREVSFHIRPGEMVGFLGSNGAGKSTILKLIAGITDPTSGEVTVSGPVTSLLELGVGFHPDLTGMENIFYNGVMMGMTRAQVLARLEAIIAFSGLADFLYEPVRHYSSGMYSRLACSVALHLEPKIILVDEILAVGDAEFQQRGILKILDLHRQGVTVLLVTHETNTARDICDRLLWIDGGRIVDEGEPHRVHAEYMRSMMARVAPRGIFGAPVGTGDARIARVQFLADGEPGSCIETGLPAAVKVHVEGRGTVRLAILWKWSDGRILCEDVSEPIDLAAQGGEPIRYDIPRWPLMEARVTASVALLQEGAVVDRRDDALAIDVRTPGLPVKEILVGPRVRWTVSGPQSSTQAEQPVL